MALGYGDRRAYVFIFTDGQNCKTKQKSLPELIIIFFFLVLQPGYQQPKNLSCPASQLIWDMIENKLPVLLIVRNILTAAVFHHKSMYLQEQDKSQCVWWNPIITVSLKYCEA